MFGAVKHDLFEILHLEVSMSLTVAGGLSIKKSKEAKAIWEAWRFGRHGDLGGYVSNFKEATGDLGANGLTLANHSQVKPSQAKSRSSQSVECGWTKMCQEGAT